VLLGQGDGSFRAGPSAAGDPAPGSAAAASTRPAAEPAAGPARVVPPPEGAAVDPWFAATGPAEGRLAWALGWRSAGRRADGWRGLPWAADAAGDLPG
jgi:hypothetical protein